MRNRWIVALLVAVVGLLAILGVWFAAGSPPTPATGGIATVPAATDAAPPAPAPRRPRAETARRWVAQGEGGVVAVVREYGTDRALADIDVSLTAASPGPDRTLTARSGADGSVSFAGVPAFKSWTLRAKAPAPLADAEIALAVAPGRQTDLGTIYLSAAFAVPGIVVDEAGAPVEGAEVVAVRWRAQAGRMDVLKILREIGQRPAAIDSAVSAKDGTFRLTKVPPGTYDVGTRRAGFANTVESAVVVSPESSSRPLRLVIREGLQAEGRVVRPGGDPAAGITVVAFPEPRGAKFLDPLTKSFATSGADGTFRLDGLTEGRAIVAASPEGEPAALQDRVTIPLDAPLVITIGGDASIEGVVTGPDAKPVAGAQVFAVAERAKLFASTTTDAEGRYALRGMATGPLTAFLVTADGFAPFPTDLAKAMSDRSATVTLVPGRNERDVRLEAGAVVRGSVVDGATQSPVPGVHVQAVDSSAMLGTARGATTDAAGKFEIRGVPMGQALLTAAKDGWVQPGAGFDAVMRTVSAAVDGGAAAPDTGTGPAISVTKADEVIERTLEIVRAAVLRGTVVDPAGAPAVAARVTIESNDRARSLGSFAGVMTPSEPRLTDGSGRFEIPGGAPEDTIRVVAHAGGLLDGRSDWLSPDPGTTVSDLTIRLRTGAVIEGRVVDAAGKPVEGASVLWAPGGSAKKEPDFDVQQRLADQAPARTDAEGAFRLSEIEPGSATVRVTHGRYLPWRSPDVSAAEGATSRVEVTLQLGATIGGTVLDPDGRPLAGATVDVRAAARPRTPGTESPPATSRTAKTDATGAFLAEGLNEGAYTAQARADGFVASDRVETATGSGPVTLRLAKAFTISGTVRVRGGGALGDVEVSAHAPRPAATAPSGRPGGRVPNASAETYSAGRTRTQSDGTFELAGLPAGTYEVRVEPASGRSIRDGVRPNALAVSVPGVDAGRAGLVIEAEPGAILSGAVFLSDGSPAKSGNVHCTRNDVSGAKSASDEGRAQVADGRFEVAGLTPGTYEVVVTVPAHARKSVEVATGAANVRLDLTVGGRLRGRVLLADGTPAPGATVTASGPGGRQSARTGADGDYEITGLAAGPWTVQASVFAEKVYLRSTADAAEVAVRDGETANAPDITCEKPATNKPPAPVPVK